MKRFRSISLGPLLLGAAVAHGQTQGATNSEAGYLDSTRFVTWSDVRRLTPAEAAVSKALRTHQANAKEGLLGLKRGGFDSVLVRKGLLDLTPDRKSLLDVVARFMADKKFREGSVANHLDSLEFGYAVAKLVRLGREGQSTGGVLPRGLAIDHLTAILRHSPSLAERVAIGVIFSDIGDLGEMRNVFADAARVAPDRAAVRLIYGWSLVSIGSDRHPAEPKPALAELLASIAMAPNVAEAYHLAASCYTLLGDTAHADRYFALYVKVGDPNAKSVRAVRDYLVKRGVEIPR